MQGPMIAEICGTQPDAMLFSKKILPMAEVTVRPSWMRAPAESFSPITGTPNLRAV